MPLMYRTVRDERGAWSLLKKAAVRAKPTASSVAATVLPKSPTAVVGAPGVSNTARIFPQRSTTATTMGASTASTAFCTTMATSLDVSGTIAGAGGSDEFADDPLPVPPQDRQSRAAAHTTRVSPESPKR